MRLVVLILVAVSLQAQTYVGAIFPDLASYADDTAANAACTGGTCPVGKIYHKTDSTLRIVCTSAGTFVDVLACAAGPAPTATALAANGANCSSGNAPLGVDASGAVESCFDVATQTELNALSSVYQPLDSDLTALAGLSSTGIQVRTGSGTQSVRTITGTANEVAVANGDGVSGNPTLSLPTGIDATKLADGSVTSTEFQYISTVTSNVQTQIDTKVAGASNLGTTGHIPYVSASGTLSINTTSGKQIYYDATNGRLLLGQTSGNYQLDITGANPQIRLGVASANNGAFIASNGSRNFTIIGGGYYNGSNFTARDTSFTGMTNNWFAAGDTVFLSKTSTSAGSTYSADYNLLISANGSISVGATYAAGTAGPTNGAIIQGVVGIGTDTPSVTGTGKLDMSADTLRLRTARTPATAGETCNAGEICWDSTYMYICISSNTWKRSLFLTW